MSSNNSSDSPLLCYCVCVPVEPPKSPVMTTAALRPASWSSRVCCQLVTPPLWSTHRSLVVSLTILWFLLLRLTPAPFGLGVSPFVCFCVGRCPAEPPALAHQTTRADRTITRSLAQLIDHSLLAQCSLAMITNHSWYGPVGG